TLGRELRHQSTPAALPDPPWPIAVRERIGSSDAAKLGLPRRFQSCEILARVMRGARERGRGDHQKALGMSDSLVGPELVGMDVAFDCVVLARRLQILTDCEEVDIRRTQIIHDLEQLVSLLAQAYHDPGLGEDRWIDLLGPLQQAYRREVACARPH